MDNTAQAESTQLIDMSIRQTAQIVIVGLLMGLLAWGLTVLLQYVVLKAVLCGGVASGCSVGLAASIWGDVAAACVGLFALVRLRVFRPLLVVIAVTVSLWGLVGSIDALPWYGVGAAYAFLYALAYIVFAWVVRVRLFWLAVCLLLPVFVIVRLLLNS